ncbi:bifunctional DNA primase/polymerase [Micropruina sp.]|uniref:bifunctional DNA primase/polymerase n=1 Tax=Micropruina sp. TaxID=2737536 RepID=UPI0039E479E5
MPLVASELARLGVPVFPCAPGEKRPIPERSFHDATADTERVEAWWRQQPDANLAIPTGAASGVVVDVDVHGVNGYAALERASVSGLLCLRRWRLWPRRHHQLMWLIAIEGVSGGAMWAARRCRREGRGLPMMGVLTLPIGKASTRFTLPSPAPT